MTADIENLILDRLGRMDIRLDVIQGDIREVKERLGHLERGQAELGVQYATLSSRMDRFSDRIERIEQRLELTEV